MDYFRAYPEQVARLIEACEGWRGTPFRKNSHVKGTLGGVDCGSFVGAAFYEIGAVPEEIATPPYELNEAEYGEATTLKAWLEQPAVRTRLRRVEYDEAHLDGDLVFPRVGKGIHHLGIHVGQLVYHVARPSGWCAPTVSQLVLEPTRYRLLA